MTALRGPRAATFAAALVSLLLVLAGVMRVSSAGFSATTNTGGSGWQSGAVTLTDDDASAIMFDSASLGLLDGGQTVTRCIAVTYSGTFTGNVAVRTYATVSGALAPYLDLTVEEGTGGRFGNCSSFTATSTLYTGTLAGYAATNADFGTGASTWAPAATPETRSYRFAVTVQNVAASQAKTATGAFKWEAQTLRPFTPADLTDNAVWLRGKDLGADGSPVTTWADQSARNLTFVGSSGTTVVAANSTPNGGKSLRGGSTALAPKQNDLFIGQTQSDVQSAAASSYFNTSAQYGATAAMDGVLTGPGFWATNAAPTPGSPQWLAYRLKTAKTITAYTVNVNGITDSTRAPKSWTFEGSNDGTSWTVLDTQSNYTFSGTTGTFNIAAPAAYLNYRINITANAGSPTMLAITELSLTGANVVGKATSGELWAVIKSDGQAYHPLKFTDAGDTRYTFSDLKVYEGFGASSRLIYTPTVSVASWRLLRITQTGARRTVYLDGVQQATDTAAISWGSYTPTVGSAGTNLAEVLVRGTVSTAAETTKLTKYFNAQHGLSVPVP